MGVCVPLPEHGGAACGPQLLPLPEGAHRPPVPVEGAHGAAVQPPPLHLRLLGHAVPPQVDPGGGAAPAAQRVAAARRLPAVAHRRRVRGRRPAVQAEVPGQPGAVPRAEGPRGAERHLGRADAGSGSDRAAAGPADSPERVQRAAAVHGALHPRRVSPAQPAAPAVPPAGGGVRAGHGAAGAPRSLPPAAAQPEEAHTPVLGDEGGAAGPAARRLPEPAGPGAAR